MEWNERFVELFDRCVERYRRGDSNFVEYYSEEDLSFLHGIGCKPRELFDFVEDYVDEQNPSPTSALLIAAVRRDYLLVVQRGPEGAPPEGAVGAPAVRRNKSERKAGVRTYIMCA